MGFIAICYMYIKPQIEITYSAIHESSGTKYSVHSGYYDSLIINHVTKRLFKSDQIWNQQGSNSQPFDHGANALPTLPL